MVESASVKLCKLLKISRGDEREAGPFYRKVQRQASEEGFPFRSDMRRILNKIENDENNHRDKLNGLINKYCMVSRL